MKLIDISKFQSNGAQTIISVYETLIDNGGGAEVIDQMDTVNEAYSAWYLYGGERRFETLKTELNSLAEMLDEEMPSAE